MEIIGVRKFTAKSGRKCCIVSVVREYTNFEANGVEVVAGRAVENIWIPEHCSDKVTGKDVGKKLVLDSTYANGKTYVNGVTVA